jgi:Ca2+-dependent lipid-binding protein
LGKLVISSVEAELTRNTELVGKMDPFVEFKLNDQVRRTEVREDEGTHCIWNQRI